jgi:hypothetical protein
MPKYKCNTNPKEFDMAKYEVRVLETLEHTVEVEASTWEEAKNKGLQIVMNGSEKDYDTESLGTQSDTILCVPISAA